MKAYVILRKGFEYDDNIYSEFDGGGGTPHTIVFSKEDAIKRVIKTKTSPTTHTIWKTC
jgi:hypothetical protein